MKCSISWHKQCLVNMEASLDRDQRKLERMRVEVYRLEDQVEFYRSQIESAEKEGKDGFDPERYLKGRK